MEFTFSHKYIKNTSTNREIHIEDTLSTGRKPWTSEKARKSPSNQVGQKKKKSTHMREREREKEIGLGPAPQKGKCEGENVSAHWGLSCG